MGSEPELRRAEPRPGDVIAGKYKIEALLGRGAMGSVYAARNRGTGKRCALKWLLSERQADMEMIARFEREARAAGRIDHPNVVTVYDVGRDGPSSFLVMELLKGYSLSKLMKQGPLPPEAAVQLSMPILRGIGAAHEQSVIHRDLKPENIFVCTGPDGMPRNTKVLDFGVSKMTDEMREGLSVTRTGMIIGTPYYMAPEQIRGEQNFDHRIDLYAAGVILYEMIAGRPPFVADNYPGLVLEIATGTPPDIGQFCSEIDAGLIRVIERSLSRHPDDRFQDAKSFGVALEPYSGGATFDIPNADWTQRIKLPRASTPPQPIDRAQVMIATHAITQASIDIQLSTSSELASKEDARDDRLATSIEGRGRSSASRKAATATAAVDSGAWHESAEADAPDRRNKTIIAGGILAAVVIVALVFVASFRGDGATETTPTEVGTPPTVTQTETVGAVAESATAPTVRADVADASPESEQVEADETGDGTAHAAEETDRLEADNAASMRERDPLTDRHAMMRAGATVGPAMNGTAAVSMMGGPRAGNLSLEDF